MERLLVDAPLVHHHDHTGTPVGLKKPVLPVHQGDTFLSSFFRSVAEQLPRYGENYVKATIPAAKRIKFVSFYSKDHGFFMLSANGHYKWSAFPCDAINKKSGKCVAGSDAINDTVVVEKILMQYRLP